MSKRQEMREYERGRGLGDFIVFLDDQDELYAFLDATDAYAKDGDGSALYRSLLSLGVPAAQIKWHAEHPGTTMIVSS